MHPTSEGERWWPVLSRARYLAAFSALVYGLSDLLKPAITFQVPFYNIPKEILPIPAWGVVFLAGSVGSFLAPYLGRFRQVPISILSACWIGYGFPPFIMGLYNPLVSPAGGWAAVALAITSMIAIRDTSPNRLSVRRGGITWPRRRSPK